VSKGVEMNCDVVRATGKPLSVLRKRRVIADSTTCGALKLRCRRHRQAAIMTWNRAYASRIHSVADWRFVSNLGAVHA